MSHKDEVLHSSKHYFGNSKNSGTLIESKKSTVVSPKNIDIQLMKSNSSKKFLTGNLN